MQELLAEGAGEVVVLLGRAVGAVVLTLLGAAVELNAISSLTAGDLAFGLWAVYMGGVALYAGLFVFGSELLDQLGVQNSATA